MDAAGLVDFDEEGGTVDVDEGTDEALALLDDLE